MYCVSMVVAGWSLLANLEFFKSKLLDYFDAKETITTQPGLKHTVRTAKWARMRRTERASRAVATVSERMLFCASVAIRFFFLLLPILLLRNLSFAEARQGIPRQF